MDWYPSLSIKASPSMKIHPVFHVSLLDRYVESDIPTRTQPPPPSIVIDNEVEYEVEQILDSKFIRKRLFYLVKWKGYPISENSWEPVSHLTHSKDLIAKFRSQHPNKPSAPLPTPESDQLRRSQRSRKVNFVGTFTTHYYCLASMSVLLFQSLSYRFNVCFHATILFYVSDVTGSADLASKEGG